MILSQGVLGFWGFGDLGIFFLHFILDSHWEFCTRLCINYEITVIALAIARLGPKVSKLPLRQWGAGNVHILPLSSSKVNIAENPIAVMGL